MQEVRQYKTMVDSGWEPIVIGLIDKSIVVKLTDPFMHLLSSISNLNQLLSIDIDYGFHWFATLEKWTFNTKPSKRLPKNDTRRRLVKGEWDDVII